MASSTSMTPVLQEMVEKSGLKNLIGGFFDRETQIEKLTDLILARVLNGVTSIEIQNCLNSEGPSKEIEWTCKQIREQIKQDFGKE